jgi:hypothetical protein
LNHRDAAQQAAPAPLGFFQSRFGIFDERLPQFAPREQGCPRDAIPQMVPHSLDYRGRPFIKQPEPKLDAFHDENSDPLGACAPDMEFCKVVR